MSEAIKFTEDELKSINEIRQTYAGVQNAFGRVGISRLRINQDIQNLDNYENELSQKFNDTQQQEKELLDKITEKYGDGQLDIQTGQFTPVSKEESTTEQNK